MASRKDTTFSWSKIITLQLLRPTRMKMTIPPSTPCTPMDKKQKIKTTTSKSLESSSKSTTMSKRKNGRSQASISATAWQSRKGICIHCQTWLRNTKHVISLRVTAMKRQLLTSLHLASTSTKSIECRLAESNIISCVRLLAVSATSWTIVCLLTFLLCPRL